MNKLYLLLFVSIVFASCATEVNYMGESSSPTSKIDFFVDASSITKNYQVIGKGFIRQKVGPEPKPEKIQQKAMQKGMEIGADAVLVQEYWVSDHGTGINTTYSVDSVRRSVISSRETVGNGFSITYLKYR